MLIGFLRTILIIAIIYYGIKLIAKYVMPFVARKLFRKMEKDYYQKTNKGYKSVRKEGEVTIETKSNENNNKKFNQKVGDYVDYEEIKE